MKQLILIAAILSCSIISYTTYAKVTLEDAYASEAEYYKSVKKNRAEYEKGLYKGLDTPTNSNSEKNIMGHWAKISSVKTDWHTAGVYAHMLSASALGKSCVQGDKGLIQAVSHGSHCTHWNSHNTICTQYSSSTTYSDNSGYKAECQ